MSVVVSDLVARVRADGVEQTTQQVKAVGDAAQQTARALEIMAQAAAKQGGGTPQAWMEIFQRGNVQPTAAALTQAAQEMQKTASAAQQAVAPVQNVARAAAEHATAARTGAQAVQGVADGWKLSESNAVRFAAGLAGVSLGISLVAGAARLVHQAIADTVTAQLDWERSLVQVNAMYDHLGPRVIALSQAQAALPGVISSQQELLQANISAQFLTTRYGVSPDITGTLTTQAARLGGLYALPAEQRQALQDAFLNYARTGAGGPQLEAVTGQAFDPLTLARRLGFSSESALQALTPQQLDEARAQLITAAAAQTNMRGSTQQRGLLDAQRTLQANIQHAQAQLQNSLENLAAPQPIAVAGQSDLARSTNFPLLGPAGERQQQRDLAAQAAASATGPAIAALQDVREARQALTQNTRALADNQRQLEQANAALAKLGVEAGGATARLLSFTGSLEDVTSIARGDVAAQAQAAVAARGRSAIPSFATPTAEIAYQATQTAYQQAYQNFVAQQAQGTQDNAIREYLQRVAAQQGPGGTAQRALDQAEQARPVQQAIGEAQRREAQLNLETADRQAQLDQVSLNQRERYVQLLRDTVDLRRLDVQQQMVGNEAQMALVRAQQVALPAQRAASAAQYQGNLVQAIAQQRMARLIQGRDVSDLPSIDELIQMNVQSQFAQAENAPGLVRAQRGVEVAQQASTAAGLAQALTEGQLRSTELANDLKNLGDLPTQTALELELLQLQRDDLSVQQEQREYLKQIASIMSNPPATSTIDLGSLIFGQGGNSPLPAPSTLPGSRRGDPF